MHAWLDQPSFFDVVTCLKDAISLNKGGLIKLILSLLEVAISLKLMMGTVLILMDHETYDPILPT